MLDDPNPGHFGNHEPFEPLLGGPDVYLDLMWAPADNVADQPQGFSMDIDTILTPSMGNIPPSGTWLVDGE